MNDQQEQTLTSDLDDGGLSEEAIASMAGDVAESVRFFLGALEEAAQGALAGQAVSVLLLQVSQLLLSGARLGAMEDVVPSGKFEPDAGYEPDLEHVREGLAALLAPVDDYQLIFDPLEIEPEILPSRLSDDLTAVAADVMHGLQHYEDARPKEALWWWQFSYLDSWGGIAAAALRALQSVVGHARLDDAGVLDLTSDEATIHTA